jgi:hypothetical protein
MKTGDYVTIRENPHDRSATGLVGLIRQVLPGAGIANCDLFRVAYTDHATGLRHIYPFSAGMLEPAPPRA